MSSQAEVNAGNRPVSISEQAFIKNAISFGQGRSLKFDGRIVRYDLIRNERGVFDRYAIESSQSLMGLEAAIFSELARKGYIRRVRQETSGRFLVHYLRKGDVTVVADFWAKKESHQLQRLVMTIRTDE